MQNSNRLTPQLVQEIKKLLAENKYYQHQIAAMLGVN